MKKRADALDMFGDKLRMVDMRKWRDFFQETVEVLYSLINESEQIEFSLDAETSISGADWQVKLERVKELAKQAEYWLENEVEVRKILTDSGVEEQLPVFIRAVQSAISELEQANKDLQEFFQTSSGEIIGKQILNFNWS